MQELASYCLKMESDSNTLKRCEREIASEIDEWLKNKGVADIKQNNGEFKSRSGDNTGYYSKHLASSKIGSVLDVRLVENTNGGEVFGTYLQIVCSEYDLVFYAVLSVCGEGNVIAPVNVYPKCPKIIRSVLNKYDGWIFGGSPIPRGDVGFVDSEEKAVSLCEELSSMERVFPIVLVSSSERHVVWRGVHNNIARELVCLAKVFVVDEESSWILTERLGKANSCYNGAIKLYWPGLDFKSSFIRSQLWNEWDLRSYDEEGGKRWFLSVLRGIVMSAASLAISPPVNAKKIYDAADRERIEKEKERAVEQSLDEIVEENDRLSKNRVWLEEKIGELESKINHLKGRLREYEKKEHSREDLKKTSKCCLDSDEGSQIKKGDVVYYKRIYSGGGVDRMVRVSSCNHNCWKPAFSGDQAEKGIQKLEGRKDWQSIQHCGSCTGGGMWRVQW